MKYRNKILKLKLRNGKNRKIIRNEFQNLDIQRKTKLKNKNITKKEEKRSTNKITVQN